MSIDSASQEIPASDVAEVIGLLTEQRDLYARLGQLAGSQRSLITGDESVRLLTILSERQQLIDKLESVAQDLRPYQANWRDLREGMSASDGEKVDGLVAAVNKLLSGIIKRDEADVQLLSARKSETSKAMGEIKAVRQARAAYSAANSDELSSTEWT